MVFTLFDEASGTVHPKKIAVTFDAAPPENKTIFRVKPPRTLAKEFFNPPSMAANASWSHRLAHGVSIRPRAMPELDAGRLFRRRAGRMAGRRHSGKGMIHLVSKDGGLHAIYKLVALDPAQKRDPKGYVMGLVHAIFHSTCRVHAQPKLGISASAVSISAMAHGAAGLGALAHEWRCLVGLDRGVPASEIAWAMPVTAGTVLIPAMQGTGCAPAIAARFRAGRHCGVVGLPAGTVPGQRFRRRTYLQKYRLGYVHAHDGEVFLVDPKRDFWLNGRKARASTARFGGENEKLSRDERTDERISAIALLSAHTRPARRPAL